ncbi:optineurin isoform X2 [Pelobates cultripes]|uniref:Optineurin n=2 Tax=Pelobates cultripes TaxID=61616 RepID=A0AAD1RS06_PELCU|nr:optineurin isoform X2 [Pelobates cultripes]
MSNPVSNHGLINGNPNVSHLAPGIKNDAEMLDQIKQLLIENNNLKETMKKKNQEMKERLEDLLKREKLREQGLSETGILEAKQRLFDLSNENELLRKEIETLKKKKGEASGCPACDTANENIKQMNTQLLRLQAEKADLLGIISELQVKLSSCASEDSFVEIRIAEKDTSSGQTENKTKNGEEHHEIVSYRPIDEEHGGLESEELAVSKLLHSLREETQKVETLEKELLLVNERVANLEKKASDLSDKETQTEIEQEQEKECESVLMLSSEVDILKQKVKSLNKELQDTSGKLTEAEQFKNKLQDKCISLDKKLLENEVDLEEKQKLTYSVQKLELQVESMQSEIRMEQSKTQAEKNRLSSLQESHDTLKNEYEELKKIESESVSKVQYNDLVQKLDTCEKALAKKQFQIDELNKTIDKHKEEVETIELLRAQDRAYQKIEDCIMSQVIPNHVLRVGQTVSLASKDESDPFRQGVHPMCISMNNKCSYFTTERYTGQVTTQVNGHVLPNAAVYGEKNHVHGTNFRVAEKGSHRSSLPEQNRVPGGMIRNNYVAQQSTNTEVCDEGDPISPSLDISIDHLNQLILQLDPTFQPLPIKTEQFYNSSKQFSSSSQVSSSYKPEISKMSSSPDFHAEREARQNIHQEKEQLATQLTYMMQENENLKDQIKNRQSIEQLQQRHGSSSESPHLVPRGAENIEQHRLPVHTCPKCNLTVPDMDTLQIHVMDCIT